MDNNQCYQTHIYTKETYNDMKTYIGIITDEWDNDSIGYNISTDIEDMLRWKSDMDTCNDVKKCIIYEVIRVSNT